jgi:hypothetical protein
LSAIKIQFGSLKYSSLIGFVLSQAQVSVILEEFHVIFKTFPQIYKVQVLNVKISSQIFGAFLSRIIQIVIEEELFTL